MDAHNRRILVEAMLDGDDLSAAEVTGAMLAAGVTPQAILAAVNEAAQELGRRYQNGECYLPELFGGAEAMTAAVDRVVPEMERSAVAPAGVVVIGVVEGDVHEIGKRIVSAMLAGAGFRIHDLGTNVPACAFVEKVRETGADIVAASAYITTTTQRLPEIERALTDAGLRQGVKFMMGGAAVSRGMAESMHADGYGENAAEALAIALRLIDPAGA